MTPLELIAHDIICIVKFNGTGGTATTAELKRVTTYLARLGKLPEPELPRVAVRIPGSNPPPPVGVVRPTPPPNPPNPPAAVGVMVQAPSMTQRAVIVALPPKP